MSGIRVRDEVRERERGHIVESSLLTEGSRFYFEGSRGSLKHFK